MHTLDEVRLFCEKKGKKKVILDTNLLLLLLVGTCDKDFISRCACISMYTSEDYELLVNTLRYFKAEIVITPHILAEFSDFFRRDVKEPKLSHYLHIVVAKLKNYSEEHIPLEIILGTKMSSLLMLGFPDTSIIEAAKKIDAAILTEDTGLGLQADALGIPNIKFKAVKAMKLITQTV